jgi:hypothetical protein
LFVKYTGQKESQNNIRYLRHTFVIDTSMTPLTVKLLKLLTNLVSFHRYNKRNKNSSYVTFISTNLVKYHTLQVKCGQISIYTNTPKH